MIEAIIDLFDLLEDEFVLLPQLVPEAPLEC
jgi:hypothetical protein